MSDVTEPLTLSNLAKGRLEAAFGREMADVIKSYLDETMDPEATRTIALKVKLTRVEGEGIKAECSVHTTYPPRKGVRGTIALENGRPMNFRSFDIQPELPELGKLRTIGAPDTID